MKNQQHVSRSRGESKEVRMSGDDCDAMCREEEDYDDDGNKEKLSCKLSAIDLGRGETINKPCSMICFLGKTYF